MTRPIVFVDTETMSLGSAARPWEIAMIRREPDGRQVEHLVQIAYPLHNLPPGTSPQALHVGQWLLRGVAGSPALADQVDPEVLTRRFPAALEDQAAERVHSVFTDEPVLAGVGVHFDAAVLSSLFLRHGLAEQPWHYAILDLKTATWGALSDRARIVPWPVSSDWLASEAEAIPPADTERHTALGDARWAARWYDALTVGAA